VNRWAQLTYTSTDPGNGVGTGGWQVRQVSLMSATEREGILARVPTRLPVPAPLPAYPAEQELAAAPRRLAYVPHDDGSALLVHTVPAGVDATGRPGNVFSHALLDRTSSEALRDAEPVRPIEFWRSPIWLTPYGPAAVRDARFDDREPVVPGTVVTRDTVVDFLFEDAPGRRDAAFRLLDAVQAALAGGPRAVVAAAGVDEAAMWIGLVSFLAAPQMSARLSFSTYEWAGDSDDNFAPLLSAVPPEGRGDAAVVDPLEHGAPATGEWAALVRATVEAGDVVLDDRLLTMDEVSAVHPDVGVRCPWWPLAVSIALRPSLVGACPQVARVILRETPPWLRFDESVATAVDGMVRAAGRRGTAEVWEMLAGQEHRPAANPELLAALRRGYLAHALADPDWLTAPDSPRVPDSAADDDVYELVELALDRLQAIRPTRSDWPLVVTRAVDLLDRYGVNARTRHLLDSLRTDPIGTTGVYR